MGKKFWQFKAKENTPTEGELMLYGDISSSESWWGDEVTPKQFKEDMDALGDISILNVYINSGGGDVFAGQAIYSMLKRHSAKVNVYVDGLAASIASVIAMAGDTVYMPKNAMMMIHNPWTIAYGNSSDFRKMADDLDKIREGIINTYQDKSGMENDKIIELMDAETWMTAQEAVDYGFADEIEEAKQVAASLNKGTLVMNGLEFDLSRFRNAPKLALSQIPPAVIKNAGRTLSADNEQRIQQARDLLVEVLNQVDEGTSDKAPAPDSAPAAGLEPPEPPQEETEKEKAKAKLALECEL